MKKILFIISVFATTISKAQTTITHFDFDYDVLYNGFQKNDDAFISTNGIGQTWDVSNLSFYPISNETKYFHKYDVLSPDVSKFPNAIQALKTFTMNTLNSPDTLYLEITPTEYSTWGARYSNGVLENLIDKETSIVYPFNYNQIHTDIFSGNYGTGLRNGVDTAIYNGFGTLKLPYGTFDSVSKFTLIKYTHDEIVPGFGITTKAIANIFVSNKLNGFILYSHVNVGTVDGAGNYVEAYKGGLYREANITAINSLTNNKPEIKLYPNPATNQITFDLGNYSNNDFKYHILDLMGRFLDAGNLNGNKTVDVSKLPSGQYYILLKSQDIVLSRTFQKI